MAEGRIRSSYDQRRVAGGFAEPVRLALARGTTLVAEQCDHALLRVPHLHLHLIPRYAGDREDPRGGVRWMFPHKAKYWP